MRWCMIFSLVAGVAACEAKPDSSMTTGKAAPSPEQRAKPGAIGELEAIEGEVNVRRDGDERKAEKGAPLSPGETVRTGGDGKARVAFVDGSILAVGPRSTLELSRYEVTDAQRSGALRVLAGQFWLRVVELAGVETRVEVETPAVVAGIRGTTLWGDTARDLICALAGEIEVQAKAAGRNETLAAGQCLSKLDSPAPARLEPDAKTVGGFLEEVHIGAPLEAK